ncbi:uncharacterized protein LOC129916410 isoform X2 [Episyrphus balteatus]|nr:uncharacterized protein LOC129916410 isoform X2 [Episyrphus balteatus]
MMLEPVSRGSRWRTDRTAPANYDDNGLYCGGYAVQWSAYAGKCGICGDSYGDKMPRPHEIGGTYGQGVIVGKYKAGQELDVSIKITQNHKGYFVFQLCNMDSQPESERCYSDNPVQVKEGGYKHYLNSDENRFYNTTIILPPKFTCKKCGLRWIYNTGNSWGTCDDGTGAIGCGPQEQFVNCADITIS